MTDEGLERNVLMGHGYSLVLFFDYCSVPCDLFRKEWNLLPDLISGIDFYELEVAENPGISKEIGIMAIPTTILFRDGVLIASYEGPYSKEALIERIQKDLAKPR